MKAEHEHTGMGASYARFAAMIATSTTIMLILMYSMVLSAEHLHWSETRFYMALYMGACMAVIMLAFMQHMYTDSRRNVIIYLGALVVFALPLTLARSQRTVGDVAWMKGMIPHHSIALTTSSRAQLTDSPCVRCRVRSSSRKHGRSRRWRRSSPSWRAAERCEPEGLALRGAP